MVPFNIDKRQKLKTIGNGGNLLKKLITICIIIAVIATIMPNAINATAATTDTPDTTIIEPLIFIDEDGNEYTLTFSKNEKDKKILWFSFGKYISSFDITMEKSTNDGQQIIYKYKTKESFWLWAPKTVEKALKKDDLSEIYDLWEDFQSSYIAWTSIKNMTNEEFANKILTDISDKANASIDSVYNDFSSEVNNKLDIKDNATGVFTNKIIDKFCAFNPDDYSSMIEDTVDFTKKIEKTLTYFTDFSKDISKAYEILGNPEYNGIEQEKIKIKRETDSKIHDLFKKLEGNQLFESEVLNYTTYKTKFADLNQLTVPRFEFIYPSDWKITKEEVVVNESANIQEWIEIESNTGITITYMSTTSKLGGNGRNWTTGEAIEVAMSSFAPGYVQATDYSSLGEFVVAKIHETHYVRCDTGNENEIDNYCYAVIPKTELGEIGYAGRYDGLSFNYGGRTHQYLFMAEYDKTTCSKEDENEIIKVLKSFKLF